MLGKWKELKPRGWDWEEKKEKDRRGKEDDKRDEGKERNRAAIQNWLDQAHSSEGQVLKYKNSELYKETQW